MIALALAAIVSFTSTPEQAAMRALYADNRSKMVVERVNVEGAYAAVLVGGGMMEGARVTSPILVERFSFGWQALELLNFRSRLTAHKLSEAVDHALMRGMPSMIDDDPCTGACTDGGPKSDVKAVREQMRGPLVPWVVVSGDYAFGEWYGGGGGDSLFQKAGVHWRLIRSGGGAMIAGLLRAYGVPESALCPFGVVKCAPSRSHGTPTPRPAPR